MWTKRLLYWTLLLLGLSLLCTGFLAWIIWTEANIQANLAKAWYLLGYSEGIWNCRQIL